MQSDKLYVQGDHGANCNRDSFITSNATFVRSVNGNWANRGSRFSGKKTVFFFLISIELPFNCEPEIHFTLQLCSNFKIERYIARIRIWCVSWGRGEGGNPL